MKLSKIQLAILAIILANAIWGGASPIFKWSLMDIPPFTLAFLRFLIATIIVFPFALKWLHIEKDDIVKILCMGLFGITINIGFYYLGLQNTASINAPIIGSSGPIMIMLGSMFFLKEHPKRKMILGSFIGLLGILLIVLQPVIDTGIHFSVLGNIFLIVATLGSTINVLIAKEICNKYHPITLTFYSFFIGAVTFFPLFTAEVHAIGFMPFITIRGLIGILFGALFSSVIAYFLYYWSMKYLLATEVGLFTYLDPITAILIAVPLLHEIPTLTYLVGSLLVFGGIYIAEGRIHYHPFHKLRSKI